MEEDSQVKGRTMGKTVSNQNASGIHESLELGANPEGFVRLGRALNTSEEVGLYSADSNEPW